MFQTFLVFLLSSSAFAATEGLSRDQIQNTISKHLDKINQCYEDGLKDNPKLQGLVRVKFVIAATGHVSEAKIEKADMADGKVQTCIVTEMKTWEFPAPVGGVEVRTSYPFQFKKLKPAAAAAGQDGV